MLIPPLSSPAVYEEQSIIPLFFSPYALEDSLSYAFLSFLSSRLNNTQVFILPQMADSELQLAIRVISVLPKMCVALSCFSRSRRIYPSGTLCKFDPEIKRFKSSCECRRDLPVDMVRKGTLEVSGQFHWV